MKVEVTDGYVYTKSLGNGERTLLMIHGGPDWDHTYFLPAAEQLSKSRRVILFDIRGCGRSSKYDDINAYTMSNIISDIEEIISSYRLSRCDILGFSFGGVVAMHLLKSKPHLVGNLILASTTAFKDFQEDLESSNEYQNRCNSELREFIAQAFNNILIDNDEPSRSLALRSIELDVHDLSKVKEIGKIVSEITFTTEWLKAFRAGTMGIQQIASTETINNSKKNVLIIHGEKDLRFPVSVAHRLNESLENSELVIIENAGHLAHLEKPSTWAKAIDRFLNQKRA